MPRAPSVFSLGRVFTLRTQLITLMSLVTILGSMCLGLYFLEMQVRYQTNALMHTGTLLAKNLAHNGRYHLFIKDTVGLQQLIAGALPVQEVVYVVFFDSSGHVLAEHSKGFLANQQDLSRSATIPLYADPSVRQQALASASSGITITPFRISRTGKEQRLTNHGKAGMVLTTLFHHQSETLYDFSVPIYRSDSQKAFDPSLSFELRPDSDTNVVPGDRISPVYGLIQIGLSDAYLQRELQSLVWRGILISSVIVLVGLIVMIIVSRRMTVPLKALTHQAALIPKGDLSPLPPSNTEDEIGQLTTSFNHMVQALRKEKQGIELQISWLNTLNTIGTSISSSSSLDKLLSIAVQQLVDLSDFQSAAIGLYDDQRRMLSSLHSSGLSQTALGWASDREISIEDTGGLLAPVLLHHRSLVVHDMHTLSHQSDAPLLEWLERQGVGSFVIVPLEHDQSTIGFLAAAKGAIRCEHDDIPLLQPVATKLAIAIDRARAYLKLEELTHTLDHRVQERTEELQTANEKLKDLDHLKSTFVSIASHELRTPLTSIKVLVENLFRGIYGPMTEEQTQQLSRVRTNVNRLRRLISDLLDLTQIETGRMKLSFTSVSLVDLVKETIDSLSPIADSKGLSIRCKVPPQAPSVVGDHDKLFQILTNLLDNAVKFSQEGGEVMITIDSKDNEQCEISVSDSGYGISPEELDRIFLPFYRTTANTSDNPGAGLGLALTRHLVELHNGHIWAESTLNSGSCFTFTLPVAHQPKPAMASAR